MGRFTPDRRSLLKSAILNNTSDAGEENTSVIFDSDDETSCYELQGPSVAETGTFTRRNSPLVKRLHAKLTLQKQRLNLFSSKAFRERRQELNVPDEVDPTTSTLGLLRSAIDPTYATEQVGDIWKYSDGCNTKEELHKQLAEEARILYEMDKRKGEYSLDGSKLKHVFFKHPTSAGVSKHSNKRLKSTSSNISGVRRSPRIREKKSQ